MTDLSTFPVSGWADEWASYDMQVIGAVVAFIRDHGPVADERVLTVIRRAGIGGDVRKASPFSDEQDGAQRILNFLIVDIDAIVRTGDGLLSVEAGTSEVVSAAKGRKVVPSADARAADAARARHTEHLRRWVFKSPFATDWRDGIRRHSDDDVWDMATRIRERGYVGPSIVCDQHGVIIDGHLRHDALRLLDINPDRYTETMTFVSDMHRLAYVIAVHQQAHYFPADLKAAIVKYVNAAASRSGEKVSWPDDIPIITGTGHHQPSPPRRNGSKPPPVVAAPALAPAPPPVVTPMPEPVVAPMPVAPDDGLYRAAFGEDTPGRKFRSNGKPGAVAQILIDASNVDQWVPRDRLRGPGSAKVDFVLRRIGWFMYDGDAWLFMPNVLTVDWTKGRVRRLTMVEIATLRVALDDGTFWDEWARLVAE